MFMDTVTYGFTSEQDLCVVGHADVNCLSLLVPKLWRQLRVSYISGARVIYKQTVLDFLP